MEKKEAKEPVEGETMTMEVEKKQVSATEISFNFNVNLNIFFVQANCLIYCSFCLNFLGIKSYPKYMNDYLSHVTNIAKPSLK